VYPVTSLSGQERADLAGVGVSCGVVQPEHQMTPVVLSIVPNGRVHCFGTQLGKMHLVSRDRKEINEAAHVAKSTTGIAKNC
jgi:hypothetical protein